MLYSLESINHFTAELKRQVVPRYGAVNFVYDYNQWNKHTRNVQTLHNQLAQQFRTDSEQQSLFKYICAIESALQYFCSKEKNRTETIRREQFIDTHVNHLINIHQLHFSTVQIRLPSREPAIESFFSSSSPAEEEPVPVFNNPIYTVLEQPQQENTTHTQRPAVEIEPSTTITQERQIVLDFIRTPEFLALEDYQQFLRNDNRNHRFFCCVDLSVEKDLVLNNFLSSMRRADSMIQVRELLARFYEYREPESAYQILNTGQNITTRLFSFMGAITTTISKMNDLYNLAQNFGVNSYQYHG